MAETMIQVENLSKKYIIQHLSKGRYTNLRDVLVKKTKRTCQKIMDPLGHKANDPYREEFWALENINFEVVRGDVVGIIGNNGAGKSTLLKILSRITEPTQGRVRLRGRVSSLLEVGTGFHPELTGRENIFLNGAILGMRRYEIKKKFDEIVAFSEIDKFIDTPVKRYSSGMYVRLAFSVAAHLEPEILLVDEVLAVGDMNFQKKCLGKMSEVSRGGRTILFVSHNMVAVSALCQKAILLNSGKIEYFGKVSQVIEHYAKFTNNLKNIDIGKRLDRKGNNKLRFIGLRLKGKNGNEVNHFRSGEKAQIELHYESKLTDDYSSRIIFSITFKTNSEQPIVLCRSDLTGDKFNYLPSKGKVTCSIPKFPLAAGKYDVNLYAENNDGILDWIKSAAQIEVVDGDFFETGKKPPYGNVTLVKHRWFIN